MHDDTELLAFQLELIKLGGPKQMLEMARKALSSKAMQRGLGGLGSGMGVGGLGGAAIGGGLGGYKSYQEAKEQGATGGQAALKALGGAGSGALKGSLLGAAAGGVGLGAAAAKGRAVDLAGKLTKARGPVGSAARFGQRQVHSLTGWTPKGFNNPAGIRKLRGGAYDAKNRLSSAQEALRAAKGTDKAVKAKKGLDKAQKAYDAAEKAEQMGLTSLPGYAKALMKAPGQTLKAGLGEQWHSGAMGKAMLVAPGALAAKELATSSEPGGPGRVERAGQALGNLAYSMGPVPVLGSTIVGGGLSSALKRGGRLADKKMKPKPRPEQSSTSSLEPAGGSATVDEYVYSPAASGDRPEIGYGV